MRSARSARGSSSFSLMTFSRPSSSHLIFLKRLQGAQAEHVAQRLGVAGVVDVLVEDRVDVAAAALHEQGDRALAQVVLDHLGGEADDVRRVAAVRDPMIGWQAKL